MKRDEVLAAVLQSADRFGADNPQQLAFLRSRLGRCAPAEVFAGLFAVFVECTQRVAVSAAGAGRQIARYSRADQGN